MARGISAKNQNSLTIARLLVEHIIPRHGIPTQLLSDRGIAFLSKLMVEVYKLLGMKKVNTTAYHSQTDSLVERFNCTLTDMLSKKCYGVVRTGIYNYLTSCLHTETALSNQQEKVHFTYFMANPHTIS